MDELRIVLLGKQGAGKSASGNTLLCKTSFHSAVSSARITQKCSKSISIVDKQTITVIDTPGWCDSSQSETDIKQEITKCIDMSSPGPHVFLLVLPIGRFTNEEIDTVLNILHVFGDEVNKYMIVLFTRGDDLDDRPIQEYLKEAHLNLKTIIQFCEGRYHVFNNRDKNNHHQVSSLLKKINILVKKNEEKYYTTAMFERVRDQQLDDNRRQGRQETVRMKNPAKCEGENPAKSAGGRRNRCVADEDDREMEGISLNRKKQEHLKQKTIEEQNRIKNREYEAKNQDIDEEKSGTRALCQPVKDQQLDNKRRQQRAENYPMEKQLQDEAERLRKENKMLKKQLAKRGEIIEQLKEEKSLQNNQTEMLLKKIQDEKMKNEELQSRARMLCKQNKADETNITNDHNRIGRRMQQVFRPVLSCLNISR